MSSSDIKRCLRKLEFPFCAKETLVLIEQFVNENGSTHVNLINELISEFVFCESSRRSDKGLSLIQELQLANTIAEYLSCCQNEMAKNYTFLTMFGGTEEKQRFRVLYVLASSAMSVSHISALQVVSVWLQQTGCTSPQALELAEKLVKDQWLLSPNQNHLQSLPDTVPHFVANLLTAIAGVYFQKDNVKFPPLKLLETIATWLNYKPTLCVSALLHSPKLPTGTILMPAVSPLAGLIHWCCLSPIYLAYDKSPEDYPKLETNEIDEEIQLYSFLHLAILLSLKSVKDIVLNAKDLIDMIPIIDCYLKRNHKRGWKVNAPLEESMERLGQTVHVAITRGRVYGNIRQLLTSLRTLPTNTLLRIVIKKIKKLKRDLKLGGSPQ